MHHICHVCVRHSCTRAVWSSTDPKKQESPLSSRSIGPRMPTQGNASYSDRLDHSRQDAESKGVDFRQDLPAEVVYGKPLAGVEHIKLADPKVIGHCYKAWEDSCIDIANLEPR